MKNLLLPLVFISTALPFAAAQSAHKYLRKGDQNYKEQNYTEAEESYRKALEKDRSPQGSYNLGNTIYRQERYEEAMKQYLDAADNARDDLARARAYHNLGNTHYQMQQFDKSVEAYKNALRLNPKDIETKMNLVQAQRMLKMQQPKPQPQQQDNQEQDQQDQQQQQQPQDDQNQEEQQNDQSQQQQNDHQEQPSSSENLGKEEARKLLEIMEDEERKVQEKMRKAQARPTKSAKDW